MIDTDTMTAYADESEQRDTALAPYLMAAYILPVSLWIDFSNEWHEWCKDHEPKIAFFHAKEAEGLCGEFDGMRPEFRNAKVRDLASIIAKRRPLSIHCWMNGNDYETIVRGKVPKELDDPYYVLWEQIIALMALACIKHNVLEPVNFIFDEKKHMEQRVTNAYHEIRKHANPVVSRLLGNTPQFESDKQVMPLQAADMLAWSLRRQIAYPDEARIIPDLLKIIEPEPIAGFPIDQEFLRAFVQRFK